MLEDTMSAMILIKAADLLAQANPDMTVRSVQVLCAVAMEEGCPVTHYAQATGMPLSTVSRLLLDLSAEASRSARRATGSGLVTRKPSPLNLRETLYSLSPKGRALFARVTREAARVIAQSQVS